VAGTGTGTDHVLVTGLALTTGLVLATQDQDPSPKTVHALDPGIRNVARAVADPVAAQEVSLQPGTVIIPAPVASQRRDMTEIRGLILITPWISLAVPPGTVLLLLASTALLHPMKICGHGVPHPLRMDMMNNPKTVF